MLRQSQGFLGHTFCWCAEKVQLSCVLSIISSPKDSLVETRCLCP
jgi:hypothetical protein